jgi:uncharacterized protein YdeI (BOF family)
MAIYEGELLTYREAGQRLGVHPDSVKRRAWRQGWERVEGNAKTDPVRIRVPAAVLAEPRTSPPDRARRTPRMSADVVATLGAALERQEMANKVLQAALDAARAETTLAQINTVKAEMLRLAAENGSDDPARRLEREKTERRTFRDQTDAIRVKLSAAEAHAAELQDKLDALEMKLQADLDAARAETALAQSDTAKADRLRLSAEKDADDLARRLEREETERRALQDQTNARRVKLSAAEAHAAELQAKVDALEMKLQVALEAARADIAQAHIDTAKADALRLAAEKGADDLAKRLEREETDRRTLQDQTDAVRVELSAAEAHAAELQDKLDSLEMEPQVDRDAARAEIAQARIDTAKADALRLAAEKGADDLARRLEREETERRALRDQTDAVRVELSAAEANAAELQAKVDVLEMKLQVDLDAARAEIAQARIDTGKADAQRLAAEKGDDDLAKRLAKEETERRILQDQTDAVRVELSAAEANAAELQAKVDVLEMKLQVDLDAARAEIAQGRIDTGKADAKRLAAEKWADDLARRQELEETDRRTFQEQTDAVQVKLSAAEAHAAELKAKVDALERKLQAASPRGSHSVLWQEQAAHRLKELERQLAAATADGGGRGKSRAPGPRKRRWWWPFRPVSRVSIEPTRE